MLAWALLVANAYGNYNAGILGTAGWVLDMYKVPVSFSTALFEGLVGAPFFAVHSLNFPLWTIRIELVGSILLFASYALFGVQSRILLIIWFVYFAYIVNAGSVETLHYVALLSGVSPYRRSTIEKLVSNFNFVPWLSDL